MGTTMALVWTVNSKLICQKSGQISEFPSKCRPLHSATQGACPLRPPFRRHWMTHFSCECNDTKTSVRELQRSSWLYRHMDHPPSLSLCLSLAVKIILNGIYVRSITTSFRRISLAAYFLTQTHSSSIPLQDRSSVSVLVCAMCASGLQTRAI